MAARFPKSQHIPFKIDNVSYPNFLQNIRGFDCARQPKKKLVIRRGIFVLEDSSRPEDGEHFLSLRCNRVMHLKLLVKQKSCECFLRFSEGALASASPSVLGRQQRIFF